MNPSDVFGICNLVAMIMWLIMIILPNWKFTRLLIDYKVIPLLLSIVYAVYIIQAIATQGMMDFGSLSSVMELFTKEDLVLGGWIHYLAFDLIVGMWILDQNRSLKINHLLIVPCLLGCFMLGPIGFFLFMIIKFIKK